PLAPGYVPGSSRAGKKSTSRGSRHGGFALPPVFPRTPGDVPTPLRGPPRHLPRWPAAGRRRRAVRVQSLAAQVDGLSLPRHLPGRCRAPLFLPDGRGRYPRPDGGEDRQRPEVPEVADCRELNLVPGRTLRTRVAGAFLFLPLLTVLGFDHLV